MDGALACSRLGLPRSALVIGALVEDRAIFFFQAEWLARQRSGPWRFCDWGALLGIVPSFFLLSGMDRMLVTDSQCARDWQAIGNGSGHQGA